MSDWLERGPKWETADEIMWLTHIGKTSEQTQKSSRAELLENYLAGARKRKNWRLMDRVKIISHAESLLREART